MNYSFPSSAFLFHSTLFHPLPLLALEGSDVEVANTVRNLACFSILPFPFNDKSLPFVMPCVIWNLVGSVQYATISQKVSPQTLVYICSFKIRYCRLPQVSAFKTPKGPEQCLQIRLCLSYASLSSLAIPCLPLICITMGICAL